MGHTGKSVTQPNLTCHSTYMYNTNKAEFAKQS